MPETETCEKCRFWDKMHGVKLERVLVGKCRRFPPHESNRERICDVFSVTMQRDFCGEWEAKE